MQSFSIGISDSFKMNKMKMVKVFNKEYAVVRTNEGVKAVSNVCPHRGASLHLGRFRDDSIQCPYHGWEFDCDGNLIKIPTTKNKPKCKLDSLNLREHGGFVWIDDGDIVPSERCGPLYSSNWVKIYGGIELDGSIDKWLMNATDISHINFVHRFGDEDNGSIDNVSIGIDENYIKCKTGVNSKATNTFTEHMQPEDKTSVTTTFRFPSSNQVWIKMKKPYEFITFTTYTPISSNKTMINWCLLYPKGNVLTDNFITRTYFDKQMYVTIKQDERVVSSIPLLFESDMNVSADKFQLEVMNRLKDEGI